MRILRPDSAAWLLAIPAAVACWLIHYQYKWRQRRRVSGGAPGRQRHARRTTALRDVAVLVPGVLAIGLLAAAMMRPQLRVERQTPEFEHRDLVLILDRSLSMRARDILPSRFARAGEEIGEFLRRKPDVIDRVALVGFAGAPVVLSYPTEDVESIFFYLDWMRDDPTPYFGTDIGAALTSALSVVARDPQRVPPVFVVISDGDDQGNELTEATAAVVRGGIRVHCIGIGSRDDAPMPLAAEDGQEDFLRDESGRILRTRFDEASLQRLASATGGRYYRSITGRELVGALDGIAAEERVQAGSTTAVEYRDLYLPLLAAAAVAGMWLAALL